MTLILKFMAETIELCFKSLEVISYQECLCAFFHLTVSILIPLLKYIYITKAVNICLLRRCLQQSLWFILQRWISQQELAFIKALEIWKLYFKTNGKVLNNNILENYPVKEEDLHCT